MDNRPIGVFDSLRADCCKKIIKSFPGKHRLFRDTAPHTLRYPIQEIVTRYSSQSIRFLLSKNVKIAVIAAIRQCMLF